jgi:hypothetical protein
LFAASDTSHLVRLFAIAQLMLLLDNSRPSPHKRVQSSGGEDG